jgi:hypothetical protein
MIVTAWNNGAHSRNGSGYGFKVNITDRDAFFKREWTSINIEFEGDFQPIEIPINPEKFWSETVHELSSIGIGRWLHHNGLAPWPLGNPTKFTLEPIEGNRFRAEKLHSHPGKKL